MLGTVGVLKIFGDVGTKPATWITNELKNWICIFLQIVQGVSPASTRWWAISLLLVGAFRVFQSWFNRGYFPPGNYGNMWLCWTWYFLWAQTGVAATSPSFCPPNPTNLHGYCEETWGCRVVARKTGSVQVICHQVGMNQQAGWWFQPFFIFHNIWCVILPIDFHIFQDGSCTTN